MGHTSISLRIISNDTFTYVNTHAISNKHLHKHTLCKRQPEWNE